MSRISSAIADNSLAELLRVAFLKLHCNGSAASCIAMAVPLTFRGAGMDKLLAALHKTAKAPRSDVLDFVLATNLPGFHALLCKLVY